MTQQMPASVSPPVDPSHQPNGERPRAPLVGVIAGRLTVVGFAAWAGVRIQAATHDKAAVAAQRSEDQKRANAAAHALVSVSTVAPVAGTWDPVVEIDGTIAAGQHADI